MNRAGFTLVELIIALVILGTGLVAAMSTSAAITRQTTASWQITRASALGRSRLETLKALDCASLTGGTATAGPFSEKWVVSGSGNVVSVTDTVTYRYGRNPAKQAFTDLIYCAALP